MGNERQAYYYVSMHNEIQDRPDNAAPQMVKSRMGNEDEMEEKEGRGHSCGRKNQYQRRSTEEACTHARIDCSERQSSAVGQARLARLEGSGSSYRCSRVVAVVVVGALGAMQQPSSKMGKSE